MTDNLYSLTDDWPFPLFQLNDTDDVRWANQAAQEWLGMSLRKLEGRNVWTVLETDPDTRGIALKARDKRGAVTSRHIAVKAFDSNGRWNRIDDLVCRPRASVC